MAASQATADSRRSLLPDEEKRLKLRKKRAFRDRFSLFGVGSGGIGVIIALGLIFVYLFYETFPLLKPVSVTPETEYSLPAHLSQAPAFHYTLDRFERIGAQFAENGQIHFFDARSGAPLSRLQVPIPDNASITRFGRAENRRSLFVYGFSDGSVLPLRVVYAQDFSTGQRVIVPELEFPLGDSPIILGSRPISNFSALEIIEGRGGFIVAGASEEGDIAMAMFSSRTNLMTGQMTVSRQDFNLPNIGTPIRQMLLNETLRNLFLIDDRGWLMSFDISDRGNPHLVEEVDLVGVDARVTAAEFLVGTRSLIVGGSDGSLRQWFLVRDEDAGISRLRMIREFSSHPGAVMVIEPEYLRKGFLVGDDSGTVGLHYATSHVTLAMKPVSENAISQLAIGPNNSLALVLTENDTGIGVLKIDNPHPQTTLSGLWGKVWYEGRSEPEFIWQSSSADDAFEAKYSIVPLSVGTLKAALFAMLLATPLAIMGAIYTAYFMSPKIRRLVKPSIELMEALPTVILGFLAGIWLAPYVENNLPILVTGALFFPLFILLAAIAWSRFPERIRNAVPPGWEAALLIPVVIGTGWLVVSSSPWIEIAFFDGSMRQWFSDVGIPYDQRNALIVGMAMGFAVIPTIFSIAEDAVFSVPRHLTQGSLALGATPWQTVVGVVLLTASPGIFSAIMIGFGRAVGETMIVLMASGNSPVVNFNLFEGMRTLAANIAVELPETAVGSTHFRVLFLSALVLLVFTFLLNTLAEIVRQRLRKRYASL
ncbi:phosphate transport system permease protein [Ectothiorhodosinus mongolicus]|uniref:Phosphate transport system permease protein n=1 Tax=Ectothiorhodosinus mongolicus TaxID=233100 RepID=A0A1R3VW84_9GAMM|nr:ABC transporter permease subunit [Ectothiorhodosinus mongolicus]ULX56967.1 phosphate ABC transporter permease [Ectothiorhodosinus mongolicus]SIT69219.1 phosphate transport system permease protein [Ectothiorhodosinus mongolicus]